MRFTGIAGTTYHIALSFPHSSSPNPGTFELHKFLLSIQKETAEEPVVGKARIPLRVTHTLGLDSFDQIDVYAVAPGIPTNKIGQVTGTNPVVNWSPTQSGVHLVWAVARGPNGEAQSDKIAVWIGMANDNFSNAASFPMDYPFGGQTSPNFVGATAEPGEPQQGGQTPVRSLWYKWTAPEAGHVVLTLAKPYSTTKFRSSVYTGKDLHALQAVVEIPSWAELRDQFDLEFDTTEGVTYWLVVDLGDVPKVESASALILLRWLPVPTNEITLQIKRDELGRYYVALRCPEDGRYMLEVLPEGGGQWIDSRELAVLNGVAFNYPLFDLGIDSHFWFRVRKL